MTANLTWIIINWGTTHTNYNLLCFNRIKYLTLNCMIRNSFSLLNVNCKQTHINNLNLVWEIELKSLELQTMKQLKNIVFSYDVKFKLSRNRNIWQNAREVQFIPTYRRQYWAKPVVYDLKKTACTWKHCTLVEGKKKRFVFYLV